MTSSSTSFTERILPGPLKRNNEIALDWSFHGLIAYACANSVIVMHAESFMTVASHNFHGSDVTSLKWFPISTDFGKEYENLLASADDNGTIILYDLNKSNPIKEFKNIEKSILLINWIFLEDVPCFLILGRGGFLKVLNMNTGHVTANHQILGADVFFCTHMATSEMIIYNSQGFYRFNFKDRMRSKYSTAVQGVYETDLRSSSGGKSYSISPFRNDDKSYVSLAGVHFLQNNNKLILIQLTSEVLMVEIDLNTVLSVTNIGNYIKYLTPLDVIGGFFVCTEGNQMLVYKEEKLLYDRHLKRMKRFDAEDVSQETTLCSDTSVRACYSYTPIGSCDFRQLNMRGRAMGVVCNPLTNMSFCITYESGKVLGLTLYNGNDEAWLPHHIYKPVDAGTESQVSGLLPLILVNMLEPLIRNPTSMAVLLPSLNQKKSDLALCAIGNASGELQIIDIFSGVISKSHKLLNYSIKIIQFVSAQTLLLVCTYEEGKNNIHHCLMNFSLKTGCYKILSLPGVSSLTPIINVSFSEKRTYMIVMLEYEESQLWKLDNMSYLLNIPDANKSTKTCCSWAYGYDQAEKFSTDSKPSLIDDVIIVNTLNVAQQYHIRNNTLLKKDGRTFSNLRRITAFIRKLNHIVIGDIVGTISIINLGDSRENRLINTNGIEGIRKLRFSPAKNNLNLFYLTGNSIGFLNVHKGDAINVGVCEIFSTVVDAEWLDAEHLILLTTNGLLNLINLNSALTRTSANESTASTWFLMPHKLCLSDQLCMRQLMTLTPWRNKHFVEEINIFKEDGINANLKSILKNCFQRVPYFIRNILMRKELPPCARAFYSSLLLGDHHEAIFWSRVCYHLKTKCDRETLGSKLEILKECAQYSSSIDLNMDFSCPLGYYKRLKFWELIALLDKNSNLFSEDINKRLQMLILLGHGEEAISYLRKMKSDDGTYYTNVLRTLIIKNKTNLSSADDIMDSFLASLVRNKFYCEVIEVLFLTNSPSSALSAVVCHLPEEEHLEYAKTMLTQEGEFNAFLRSYLARNNGGDNKVSEIRKTCLIYMSIGDFKNALAVLNKIDCVNIAAVIYESLVEFSLLDNEASRTKSSLEEKLSIYLRNINIIQDCCLGNIQ